MARSHWYFAATWAAVLAVAAVACGDSATGTDIPEPEGDGGSTVKDAGSSGKDSTVPSSSSSSSSSGSVDSGVDSGPKGDGGLPTVSVSALDFGEVDCGKTGEAKTFTISNPSGAAVSFTSELVKGGASPYTLSPPSGSVPAGGSVDVTVTPKAVPVPSATTGNALGDTVKLTIGPTNAQVDLKQTAHGVSLKLVTNSGTDFGNVSKTAGAVSLPIQVANAGNQAAPITLSIVPDPASDGGPNAFAIVDTIAVPNPTTATPGLTPAQVSFTPAEVASYNGKVHLEIGAGVALCDVAPADVTFQGKGTDGVVSINPLAFTFGNPSAATTDCGTQATTQVVHITNSSNKTILIKSAALGKGTTLYSLTSGTTTGKDSFTNLSVAANATVDISIVPKLIPQNNGTNPTTPDAFADTLTITTDAPGDTDPHVIPLHQTARGAYVVRSTNSTIALGTVAVGITSAPQTFTWQNVGNADINLTQTLAAGLQFGVSPGTLALGAGASPTTASVTFTPTSTASFTDTINVVQKAGESVVLCQTLPGGLGVSGTGGSAQLVANNSSTTSTLAFGGIACGTASPSSKNLKIQNNGPAGTYTAALRKAISPFTISSTGGPIGAGETITIQVTPKAVGNDIGTVSDQTDVIDITSDTASNTPAVTVTYTPQGAIIAVSGLSGGALAWGNQKIPPAATTSKNLTLQNNGNVSIPLTLTPATTGPVGATGIFTGLPSTMTLQPGAASAQQTAITFAPAAATVNYTGTFTVAAGGGGVLCAPIPQGSTLLNGVYPLTGTGVP